MRTTFPVHILLFDKIALIIHGKEPSYEAPHFSVLSSLLLRPYTYFQIDSSATISQIFLNSGLFLDQATRPLKQVIEV